MRPAFDQVAAIAAAAADPAWQKERLKRPLSATTAGTYRKANMDEKTASKYRRLGVSVHGSVGDWSIFRREIVFGENNVGRKHGPVPCTRRKGDSPVFAAIIWVGGAISTAPQKSGQSPLNDYRLGWLPSEVAPERTWPTREDPFAEVWPEVHA